MSDDAAVPDPPADTLSALVVLAAIPADAWTEGSIEDRGATLVRLRAIGDLTKEAAAMVELSLTESMDTDIVDTPFGRLHRSERRNGTWRGEHSGEQMRDDLARAVANDVAIDVATGDIDPMKRNVALHAMRTAYEAIPSFSSLLKGGSRRLGLNIGDYRQFTTTYKIEVETPDD